MELTKAELSVLAMAATGATNETIADNLGYALITVHGHLRSIYKKLNLDNAVNKRVSAVLWYLEHTSTSNDVDEKGG